MKVTGPLTIPPDLQSQYRQALADFGDALRDPKLVKMSVRRSIPRPAPTRRQLTRVPSRTLNLDAAELRELAGVRYHLRVEDARGRIVELAGSEGGTWRLTVKDPRKKKPKKKKDKAAHKHRFTLGDKSISRAAMEAAGWLASRWPSHVREVGTQQFIADRYNEIRHKQFPAPYWTECEKTNTRVCRWGASSVLSSHQPPAPYFDPDRKRTTVTYEPEGQLYPFAAADGSEATPFPGFRGRVIAQQFCDIYHAAQVDDFELPRRYWIGDNPPLFLIEDANIEGIADGHPPKTIVSTYHHSIIYHDAEPLSQVLAPIAIKRRRYNWKKQFARQVAGPYAYARHHVHTVDAQIKAQFWPVDDHCTKLRVFHSSAAAMGTYYGAAAEITTQYAATVTAYMAEKEPAEPQAYGQFTRAPFYRAHHSVINPRIAEGQSCGLTAWIYPYSTTHPFDLVGRSALPQALNSNRGHGAAAVLISNTPTSPAVDLWSQTGEWHWKTDTEGYCPVFGTSKDGAQETLPESAVGWWLVTETGRYEHFPGILNLQRLTDTYVKDAGMT
jgi:hypothetical protein